MQKAVLTLIRDWDPRFQSLVRMADPSTITPLPIHSSVPIQPWETKTITLLGDAIHSMTPMRGIGANTALRDAELLCENSFLRIAEKSRFCKRFATTKTRWSNMDLMPFEVR